MRSLFVRSPLSLAHCDLISGAILLAWLATTQSCPAQETPTAGQDKKPGTASPRGGGDAARRDDVALVDDSLADDFAAVGRELLIGAGVGRGAASLEEARGAE